MWYRTTAPCGWVPIGCSGGGCRRKFGAPLTVSWRLSSTDASAPFLAHCVSGRDTRAVDCTGLMDIIVRQAWESDIVPLGMVLVLFIREFTSNDWSGKSTECI